MDARREVQRISSICASRATTQTRFLAATRRDGAVWSHFCVARPRRTSRTPSGSCLELRPNRLRRMRESKSDRLLALAEQCVEESVLIVARAVPRRQELAAFVRAFGRKADGFTQRIGARDQEVH